MKYNCRLLTPFLIFVPLKSVCLIAVARTDSVLFLRDGHILKKKVFFNWLPSDASNEVILFLFNSLPILCPVYEVSRLQIHQQFPAANNFLATLHNRLAFSHLLCSVHLRCSTGTTAPTLSSVTILIFLAIDCSSESS